MKRSSKSIFCITGILLFDLCVGNPYQNALKEFARDMRRVSHARTLHAAKPVATFAELIKIPSQDLQEMYKGMPQDARHELERAYYLKTGQLLSPKPVDFKFGYSLEEVAATADPQIIKHVVQQVTPHPGSILSWPSEKGMNISISIRVLRPNATIVSIQGLMALLKSANYDPESIGKLNIENNEITELPDEGFVGLKILKSLSLANNHIVQLSEKSLAGLVNLESLFLRSNKIPSLPAKALVGLQQLRFVSLAHNRIAKLTAETFADATSLDELDLSNNSISVLSANMLVGLKNLKKLWLAQNQIRLLDVRTFIGFKKLERLVLAGNSIDNLPQHAFLGLESLSYLNLSNNRLKELPQGLFGGLKKLTMLELGGNPFPGSALRLEELRKQYPGLFVGLSY